MARELPPGAAFYRHGLRRMTGRDIREHHRPASSLELLFDLTFVAAFSVAGGQLAHGVAGGHAGSAVVAFAVCMLSIIWAWVNYSWFASAFDTDDWLFRLLTLVQMAGVVVLAIGIPQLFESVEHGEHLHAPVMVFAYVVMRVALIAQWLRSAGDPRYRAAAISYAVTVGLAQVGWILLIVVLDLPLVASLVCMALMWGLELTGPLLAERKSAAEHGGTPWHPHHIAERYSLLTIITLGESVVGTLAAAQEISANVGWSFDTVVVIAAGLSMSFALWWTYFLLPSGPVLAARRQKVNGWAYGHIPMLAAIAAVGAGLHVVGFAYEPEAHVSTLTTILAITLPELVYLIGLYLVYAYLVSGVPRSVAHLTMTVLPVLAIVGAALGWPLWVCLLVAVAGPVTLVVSYEVWEWRPLAAQLDRAVGSRTDRD